jgi:hypothetical protein
MKNGGSVMNIFEWERVKNIFLVFLVVFIFSSCSHILIPVDGPLYRGKRLAEKDLKVKVLPGRYSVEFKRDDPYIPIHITVRNESKRNVKVSAKNFLLLDDMGNKFEPVPVKEILEFYKNFAFYVFPYHMRYSSFYGYPMRTRFVSHDSIAFHLERIRSTLIKTDILSPGEMIEGFLYFRGAAFFADEALTLVARFAENNMTPVEYIFLID